LMLTLGCKSRGQRCLSEKQNTNRSVISENWLQEESETDD